MKYLFLVSFFACCLNVAPGAQAQSTSSQTKTTKVKKEKKKKAKKAKPDTAQLQGARPDTKPGVPEPKPAPTSVKPEKANTPEQAAPTLQEMEVLLDKANHLVQPKPNGEVNWTTQYITAKGQSVIDNERFKNPAQAKAMARRGAVVEAQRNLLEIVKGVNVVGETKVKDMIAESDFIYTRVEGVIKGAEVVGEPVEKDGLMEVTMRVPLYQRNGLAPAFYQGNTNTATARLGNAAEATAQSTSAPSGTDASTATRFAFNLNGHTFDPSLFPVLVDENSNLLFDLSKLYDPSKGQFPQLVQTTRALFEQAGFQKGVEVIDIIQTAPGKLVVDNKTKDKINSWKKVGKTLWDIGKLLLLVI